jgi:hypothetical protein
VEFDNLFRGYIALTTDIISLLVAILNLCLVINEIIKNRIINLQLTISLFLTLLILLFSIFFYSYRNDLIENDKISQEDRTKLTEIINSEATAVMDRNINLIGQIFLQNATITDRSQGRTVSNPIEFYQNRFQNIRFIRAEHTNINIEELTANFARISCGSDGEFIVLNSGFHGNYNNLVPNADLFELKKDHAGSWHIIYFSFR